MQKVIVLNKKEGETPLQALGSFCRKHKEYKDLKMTYAGRLDPMASGLLIILAGEETKNKEKYLRLNKEYNFEILFGFATDTYDILGKVTKSRNVIVKKEILEKIIKNELKNFKGKFVQQYPIYSSKTVGGKQLFKYARDEEEVDIPSRDVEVKSLKLNSVRKVKGEKIRQNIIKRIGKVKGDFRQKDILKIWSKKVTDENYFFIASLTIKCSTGTYVRGIANSIGENIDIPTLAWSIKRTQIGRFKTLKI
ncbi:MAG: hypothetical protein EOM85_01985 [Candidatus Moranbacteria bacterium]|nr:hypothetical protein [Candidatus Moranbacteria bacterium]